MTKNSLWIFIFSSGDIWNNSRQQAMVIPIQQQSHIIGNLTQRTTYIVQVVTYDEL